MMELTMKDKIGYRLGDTACGFVWQATMFLLAYFLYRRVWPVGGHYGHAVFGLPRARRRDRPADGAAGGPHTRYGQFRPFLLWGRSRLASSAC